MSDDSAAEIFVDGTKVGQSPASYTEGLSGKDSQYTVEAKLASGKVVSQTVTRSETAMGAVGIGAGAGAAACCAISSVTGVGVLFISILAVPGFCVAAVPLVAGPGAAYFLAGQSPDVVTISPDGRPAGAPPPAVRVAPERDAAQVATAW